MPSLPEPSESVLHRQLAPVHAALLRDLDQLREQIAALTVRASRYVHVRRGSREYTYLLYLRDALRRAERAYQWATAIGGELAILDDGPIDQVGIPVERLAVLPPPAKVIDMAAYRTRRSQAKKQ